MGGRQTNTKGTTGKDRDWLLNTENILALIDCLEMMKKVHKDRLIKIQKNKYAKH